MAVNEKRLRITEFDFNDVKDNLKTFLKGQTEFKDYDFEGSGMNILLDTLAYNTHYLGFNANMLAISSTVDGTSYQFVTISDVTASNNGGTVSFDSTQIYEGTYLTTKFVVDTSDADQRFVLGDNRADTSTLVVKVQTSSTDTTTTTYTKATDISQLSSTSTVYYLQEVDTGRFEIYFGDGVVSRALSDGNIVILNYVVTNKTAANGASTFSAPSTIDGVSSITITPVSNAGGGAEPESLDSIKLQAPLDFASQGRAVTTDDYAVYARKLFPNTQAVSVFG